MLKSKLPPRCLQLQRSSFSLGQGEDTWECLPPHPVNTASKPPARWRRGIFMSKQMITVMTKKIKAFQAKTGSLLIATKNCNKIKY